MIQDPGQLEQLYKNFVLKAIEHGKVWTLVKHDEMALFDSQLYEGLTATPFFSDRDAAFLFLTGEWADFEVAKIELSSFLERWLTGLYNKDIMVAAIWNDVATGREFEPLELLLDFLEELQQRQHSVSFDNYFSIDDFILKIKDSLSE
ncbi:MAG: hypothetical protein BGO09_03260 [Bacteroidetes bacterium 47-18]|nr:MAG: hypothetical protein BGO09_03260 [Bacteroidetes bacterium 47-18]